MKPHNEYRSVGHGIISSWPAVLAALTTAVMLSAAVPQAPGQCTFGWKSGGQPAGPSGPIHAAIPYDGKIIAGGNFQYAGGVACNYIAKWDSTQWSPLGIGMSGDRMPTVDALTVYNGEPVAGGWFATADGVECSHIAQWDGAQWRPLGSGMNSGVCALTVYNGRLIAGGYFWQAGGVACSRIAKWTGTQWAPLGSGMGGAGYPSVYALTVYNDDLIAGGGFTAAGGVPCNYIARWDGTWWAPLGSGMDRPVDALTVYNGALIAAGWFTTAGGIVCNGIAKWDGTRWIPLGSGVSSRVHALTVYNNGLIAGGRFTSAGSVGCNYIARWDGTQWGPMGSGMDGYVYALTVYNGELIAGGWFTTAGGLPSAFWARWGCLDTTPPVLTAAVSHRTHGSGPSQQDFDIDLPLDPPESAGIECRAGGPTTIVFTFSEPVASGGAASVGRLVDGPGPDQKTVLLTDVPDESCLAITLHGITDPDGNPLAGDNDAHVCVLAGDVTGDRVVNLEDLSAIKSQLFDPLTEANFRTDVYPDAVINIVDLQTVKGSSGSPGLLFHTAMCP